MKIYQKFQSLNSLLSLSDSQNLHFILLLSTYAAVNRMNNFSFIITE